MKDHKYKRQDWEKPHVIVFGQFPPYPETPYGMKQNHNHYHYSLFGSASPIATKLIGKDQQGQSRVEYVKVEKEEVIQRVIEKVQVVQMKKQVAETKNQSIQIEQKSQKHETPNVQIQEVSPLKEPEIKQEPKFEEIVEQKLHKDAPREEQTTQNVKYPDLSLYNPFKCALELRYAGMLSFSLVSFALFRNRNLITPLISIPKIRNATYISGALALLLSVPFLPQIKSLLQNKYRFIKRRLLWRNSGHRKCNWSNRRKKYQAPQQFTFLSKGEYYTNY